MDKKTAALGGLLLVAGLGGIFHAASQDDSASLGKALVSGMEGGFSFASMMTGAGLLAESRRKNRSCNR